MCPGRTLSHVDARDRSRLIQDDGASRRAGLQREVTHFNSQDIGDASRRQPFIRIVCLRALRPSAGSRCQHHPQESLRQFPAFHNTLPSILSPIISSQ